LFTKIKIRLLFCFSIDINRLNSALEDDKVEHHFQYVAPPIEDTNTTSIENQTREDIQVSIHVPNETISSTSTSIQSPPEQDQQINENLSSTSSSTQDDEPNVEIISQEIHQPVDVQNSQQNIVKEDALFVHKETVIPPTTTEQHDNNSSSSVVNTTVEQVQPNQTLSDATSETLQQTVSVDIKSEQQDVKVEATTASPTPTVDPELTKIVDTKIDEQPVEPVKDVDSVTTPPPSIQTEQDQPIETVSDDIKPETVVTTNTESTLTLAQTAAPPTRVLRSATSRLQHRAQQRQRELREKERQHSEHSHEHDHEHEHEHDHEHEHEREHEHESITTTTATPPVQEQFVEPTPTTLEQKESYVETPQASTSQSTESIVETTQAPTVEVQVPSVEPIFSATIDDNQVNETEPSLPNLEIPAANPVDLPRQVHVHDQQEVLDELKIETDNSSLEQEIANDTNVDSFLTNDQPRHLPRVLENEQTDSIVESTTVQTIETSSSSESNIIQSFSTDTKAEETNHSLPYKTNTSDQQFSTKNRQVCWRLAKPLESSFELIENQTLRFADLLPEFLQAILFGQLNDRETRVNTLWFSSICGSCFFFSLIFLSMAAKRLKQGKHEKEIRARCQQLQQYNNQLELERATFERENQK